MEAGQPLTTDEASIAARFMAVKAALARLGEASGNTPAEDGLSRSREAMLASVWELIGAIPSDADGQAVLAPLLPALENLARTIDQAGRESSSADEQRH